MLKQLLSDGKSHLEYFFNHIDLEAANEILKTLHECQGLLFLTGVGKSELTAKKTAFSMTSTGTRAVFIPPTNALHGDIGLISPNDLFIAFSKSGESDELLNLVPFIRNRGAKSIAIVSSPNNRLSRACDMTMVLPLQKELCPFNMAPTISTQIQMIFGDLLTVGLMNLKKFTLEDYAKNHPAGQIGRRLFTKVENLMLTGNALPTCHKEDKLLDTIVELSKKRCGCVFVVEEQRKLIGIFTDGDLGRALNQEGSNALEKPISHFMTRTPRCISKDALCSDAIIQMESECTRPITVLAVTDKDGNLIGLIKMHDILQAGI